MEVSGKVHRIDMKVNFYQTKLKLFLDKFADFLDREKEVVLSPFLCFSILLLLFFKIVNKIINTEQGKDR